MTSTATAERSISAEKVRQWLNDDPTVCLIDVRTGGEFAGAHIHGSHNVPLDSLGTHASDLAAVDRPVVLVCKSGARAAQAQASLAAAGSARVQVMSGGLDDWERSGGDVVRTVKEVWAMDRQVRLVAGSLSLVGILGSIAVPKAKWLSGAVAGGLTFSALSNTCAMANALGRLPYNRASGTDVATVVDGLKALS